MSSLRTTYIINHSHHYLPHHHHIATIATTIVISHHAAQIGLVRQSPCVGWSLEERRQKRGGWFKGPLIGTRSDLEHDEQDDDRDEEDDDYDDLDGRFECAFWNGGIVQIKKYICVLPGGDITGADNICQITKCIGLICKTHYSTTRRWSHRADNICPNYKLYLSELQIVFFWITNCICLNCQLYLSKWWWLSKRKQRDKCW